MQVSGPACPFLGMHADFGHATSFLGMDAGFFGIDAG